MPQLDNSTYLSQVFWLSIVFGVMLGVFIGIFLPKLTKIFHKRFEALEQADSKIKNLDKLNHKLQKSYEEQRAASLQTVQAEIDASLVSARETNERRMHALEVEIQEELSNIRYNYQQQSDNFMANYQEIIDEAAALILEKLVGQEKSKNGY